MHRRVATVVGEQQHVAAAAARQVEHEGLHRGEALGSDQPVDAVAHPTRGEAGERRAVVDVVVDRDPDLPDEGSEGLGHGVGEQRAVGGEAHRQRGLLGEPPHQGREALEGEGFAAAEGDLQGAPLVEVAEQREGLVGAPAAGGGRVARAEGARQVACVGDRELHHPRRAHPEAEGLQALAEGGEPGAPVEEQQRVVEGEAAHRREGGRELDVVLRALAHGLPHASTAPIAPRGKSARWPTR